jgi:hypothetical protein
MLHVKVAVLAAMIVPLCACSEGKPPQSQAWTTATGAEAYERLWWKAVQDHDFATAERRLAPIYTLTTPAGIVGRDKAIQYFQALDLTNINIAELEVKPEGTDMVVSYTATLQTKGSPSPQRCYMTTVWQQVTRGWIAIAHSEVPAKPAQE